MENIYYNHLLQGDTGALKRALYKSMGFTDEALSKPLIGIVNTYANANPGHYNINELCRQAKKGLSGGRDCHEFRDNRTLRRHRRRT